MVVTAGPGAGKTRILSHRFCFILLTDDYVSIPRILTLTFTEKAAEEMKGRIYEMLSQLDREVRKGADESLKTRIREARDQFHRNRISTIHSFCANLLREHPVESGMDPGFAVIQGARQSRIMGQAIEAGLSSVWQGNREIMMPLLQTFGGRNRLISAVRNLIDHPLTFNRVVETRDELFRNKGWEELVFRDYCHLIRDRSLIPYLRGLNAMEGGKGQYDELLSLINDWYESVEKDQDTSGLPDFFHDLRRIVGERKPFSPTLSVMEGRRKISYIDLVDEFYPDLFHPRSPDHIFGSQVNLFLEVAAVCLDKYKKEKQRINALDFADLEARSYIFLTDLSNDRDQRELKMVQQRFKYIMVDEFQDTNRVQWDIVRRLCSSRGETGKAVLQPGKLFVVGDKRQAIYRFRGGDVTVFEAVTEEIKRSNTGDPVPMFWQRQEVRDRIDRIYEGYPESFKQQSDAYDSLSGKERTDILNGDIYLPHNFRTDSRPIDFFNRIFEEIFSNKGAVRQREYETAPRKICMPDGRGQSPEERGSVSFYLTRAESRGKKLAETEAVLMKNIIERILGKHGKENYEYKSFPDIREKIEQDRPAIGILFFAFSHLKSFESIFREAGLPFRVHRGKGFYRCQEVMDMVQLLNFLSDERQRISLLSILRSPVLGLADSEIFDLFYGQDVIPDQFLSSDNPHVMEVGRQILSWRLLSNRLTLAELIRKVIADRSLTAILSAHPNGRQRLANMEKLIEIARRFQTDGNGSLPEFVEYCLEMADQEEEEGEALVISGAESPICLMTIHAAKGLEFPMVIIPDLDRRIPARPRSGKPVRLYPSDRNMPGDWNHKEGEIPVWQVEIPGLHYTKEYSPLGYLLMRRNSLEDMAENRRVFYVGCTRARNHLILMGNMKKSLMEKERVPITSDDYRELATIMDLLDDIYGFSFNFPLEESHVYEGKDGLPSVIWGEPGSRGFTGVPYGGRGLDCSDFGEYDDRIKGMDLSGPIEPPPYFQLSFKSISIFRKCPAMFYYSVILGIKMNGTGLTGFVPDTEAVKLPDRREEEEAEYSSRNALFVGSLIHDYLERHRFGDQLDEALFMKIWERLCQTDQEGDSLDETTLEGLRERSLIHLKNTIHDERLVSLLCGEVDYAEVPFLISVSQGCEFRGVIDRLFRDRDRDCWSIIDWKSNDLSGKDPADVAEENGYNLQLACYKWAVERILNQEVGDVYIYFTDRGHLHKSQWEGDPGELIETMLERIREFIGSGDQRVSDLMGLKENETDCRSCEYRELPCKTFSPSVSNF